LSQDVKVVVDGFIGISLGMLVESGFVPRDLIDRNWYSRFDMNHRLSSDEFFAAASIDDANRPVVVFNAESNIKALAWAIPHEAIHLAQICKKDLEPCNGYSIWKGQRFPNLSATDPNYFSQEHQPWEAEAKELEDVVRNALYEKLPQLK
jgi:hypothetical protein